jgi:hypothetical protein
MSDMILVAQWQNEFCPGHLAGHRDEKHAQWDKQYGKDNWRLTWIYGKTYLDFLGVCAVYEDAYYQFLVNNSNVAVALVNEACQIYDDQPSNILSGLDYTKQETDRTHIQDIAIRRCMMRMGLHFEGDQLIRIRQEKGNHALSMILSPGRVPFHKSRLILQPELEPTWWQLGSVESFYQSNRILQTRFGNCQYIPDDVGIINDTKPEDIPKDYIAKVTESYWPHRYLPS